MAATNRFFTSVDYKMGFNNIIRDDRRTIGDSEPSEVGLRDT